MPGIDSGTMPSLSRNGAKPRKTLWAMACSPARVIRSPETAAQGVVHVAFTARHADVVNEPTPRCIAVSVNQQEAATGP